MIIRQEPPEDADELARVIDAAFGATETSTFRQELRESAGYVPELTFLAEDGEAAWMAAPLSAYDPELRGRVVYPPFFPPPPRA